MSNKKSKSKGKKCNFKCTTCEFYDTPFDYCTQKEIENCSEQVNTDFSQCESYLVRENLVMF